MRHGIVIAVVGILIFLGVGSVMAASVNCGVGPAVEGERGSASPERNDDQSFFAHMVCVAKKPQHNR